MKKTINKIPPDLMAQTRVDSPVGELTLAATARGLAVIWFDEEPIAGVPVDPDQRWLQQAARELDRYWGNGRNDFSVPFDLHGTPFQRAVWQALQSIPAGTTCSYTDIAERAGVAHAVRAVGAAIGRNPAAIAVPCHRVIGRDGTLTGYDGGLPRKVWLLNHESQPELALA